MDGKEQNNKVEVQDLLETCLALAKISFVFNWHSDNDVKVSFSYKNVTNMYMWCSVDLQEHTKRVYLYETQFCLKE